MRILCCQYDVAWEDKAANFDRVGTLLSQADPEPGTLIVLPEMFATGFSMESEALAEDPPNGETLHFLAEIARRHNCPILAGAVVREDGILGNAALLVSRDGHLDDRYLKMHPFSFAGEDRTITAGPEVKTFSLPEGLLTPFICYDLRFPEVFRAAHPDCVLYVVIANWPAARTGHWHTLLRARAIENQAFVVGVNRVGDDPNVSYAGRSAIIDPTGKVIADAGESETILAADLDFSVAVQWRNEFPAQRDRHPFPHMTGA